MDEVSTLAITLEELRIEAAIFDNIYSRAVILATDWALKFLLQESAKFR